MGNGPQYFVVEAKNGLKYEYGNSTSSRVVLGGTVLRWMLNKVYDRNGNNYIIAYNNTSGYAVPDVISWTPTSLNASTYRYEAKFNYWTGRSDADSYIGKVAGYDVSNRYRLSSVQVKSASVVKRKYVFTYESSASTTRSRLKTAKECSDDGETNCLLPVTFNYQEGQAGITAGAGTPPTGSSNGLYVGRYDLNGDGKDDIAYKVGTSLYVAFGANNGFSSPYNTAVTTTVVIDKFLPNGRDTILTIVGGTIWSYRWDDATSTFVGYNTGIASTILGTPVDFNGDGLVDLANKHSSGGSIQVRANTSNASSSNPNFASTLTTVAFAPTGYKYAGFVAYPGKGLRHMDFNGDGRQDVSVVIIRQSEPYDVVSLLLFGSNTGFTISSSLSWLYDDFVNWPAINFNGDSCTDRVNGATVNIAACNGLVASTVTIPATPILMMDWDGDGKTDFLVDNGGYFGVYKSTGTGVSSLIPTSIPASGTFFDTDLDGDGLDDLVKVNGTAAISYWTHTSSGAVPLYATNIPDLLTSVVDGFGVTNSPNYVSTAAFQYTTGAATLFPLEEAEPQIVVAQVTSSDGILGSYSTTYTYSGARVNVLRGTHAGFQRVTAADSRRNGIVVRQYFEQQFPLTGMLSQVEVMQSNGVTPISREVNTNSFTMLDTTANNQRYFAYPSASTATQYEFGGTWNGNLLRTVSSSYTFETTGGTLYDRVVVTTEPASGANGVTAGGSWTARTYAPPANLLNDTTNWCLGRPGQVQQINSHNLTNYGAQITRTTNTTWNASFCRPTQTVAEPGSGTLQVTTDIGYDSFGNVNSTVVTGTGMEPRSTTASYSDATYTTGQFPLSETRAVSAAFNQTSTVAWNYDLGVPSSATDANSLTTAWQYDGFGRRTREDRPDTTYTTWDLAQCQNCDPRVRSYVARNERMSDGTPVRSSTFHLDQFDRAVIVFDRRHDGTYNVVQQDFDSLGRPHLDYAPRI
jgi:YD repeat-containing protein